MRECEGISNPSPNLCKNFARFNCWSLEKHRDVPSWGSIVRYFSCGASQCFTKDWKKSSFALPIVFRTLLSIERCHRVLRSTTMHQGPFAYLTKGQVQNVKAIPMCACMGKSFVSRRSFIKDKFTFMQWHPSSEWYLFWKLNSLTKLPSRASPTLPRKPGVERMHGAAVDSRQLLKLHAQLLKTCSFALDD